VNARITTASSETADSTEALDLVFRAHYERVARVIGRVIHDQARAEELAVDVFLKWWRNPAAHGDGAEGWLYRTAVRQALDELRRQHRRARFERLFHPTTTPPTPDQVFGCQADQGRVRRVLASLKRRHAEVLLLRYQGLSYDGIARALSINPAYVGSLLSRALEAFRKDYENRYGTPQ
jgi:RNA polymerase sigma factor (sigma-70 family)